jgi:hypothetical protein
MHVTLTRITQDGEIVEGVLRLVDGQVVAEPTSPEHLPSISTRLFVPTEQCHRRLGRLEHTK